MMGVFGYSGLARLKISVRLSFVRYIYIYLPMTIYIFICMICSILVFLEETGGAEALYRKIIIKEQKGQKSYRKIKEQMICSICMEQVGNCFVLVF